MTGAVSEGDRERAWARADRLYAAGDVTAALSQIAPAEGQAALAAAARNKALTAEDAATKGASKKEASR